MTSSTAYDIENRVKGNCGVCNDPLWINGNSQPSIIHEVAIGYYKGRKIVSLKSCLLKSNCGKLFHADCISKRVLGDDSYCIHCSQLYSQKMVDYFEKQQAHKVNLTAE